MSEKRLKAALAILYPVDPSRPTGGLQNVACNLVKGFQNLPGIELHVVHATREVERSGVVQDGRVFVHYCALPRRRILPNMVTAVLAVWRELRRIRPDVVNAHASHYAAAAVLAGCPTAYTIHGIMRKEAALSNRTWYDRLRYGMAMRFDAYALRRVTRLVAINSYVMDEYGDRLDDRWREVPVPIAEAYFGATDRTVPGRILSAGTIIERKNGLALLQALKQVRQVVPEAHVHFAGRAGEPEYFEKLQRYIAENDLADAVTFHGLMTLDTMVDAYGECAVLALTSRQETAPAVILEAGAAFKPSVAMRTGGVGELIADGESGFVVDQEDVGGLAERLTRLLRDDALRRRMGAQARHIAESRYRVSAVVERYAEVYRETAEAGRAR